MTKSRAEADLISKDGFLFIGNQLVLDFLNTRPVQNGEPMELLADFTALPGALWILSRYERHPAPRTA